MNALRETNPAPADEMARLHAAGFTLIPLGGGDDGKSPLRKFTGERLTLSQVLGPMHGRGSTCYGIRLDGLAVVDCDADDEDLVAEMESCFGPSPVRVKTPRGVHLYYLSAGKPPNLRSEGLPVDIKRGSSAYVMGPGSVRPDGGAYVPLKGVLGEDQLPCLGVTSACNPVGGGSAARVMEGKRNLHLTQAAMRMVEAVTSAEELFGNLQFIRDEECVNPETIPDREVKAIADWAWSRRLEGKVFRRRKSAFRIDREAVDSLKGTPNGSDAIALFVTLQDLHGHIPGKTFTLHYKGMLAAGHTDLSRRRFLDARRTLERAGLLEIANPHSAAHHSRAYRLVRHRAAIAEFENVLSLSRSASEAGGTGGGVSYLHMSTSSGPTTE